VACRLTVLGTGYLGAAHAVCMAELGFEVLGVDTSQAQVSALAAGRLPFHEPGLETLLRRGLDCGLLRFSTSYREAAAFGDVHFVCVGTPQLAGADGADLSQLQECIDKLAPLLTRPCLVVGKSTVPVGTAGLLAERLSRLAPIGRSAELAWNPEFLREGHAVADTLQPDRIVAGVRSARAEAVLREVYARPLAAGTPMVVGRFLGAGLGFGGGCLPKDIRAFGARAQELGAGQALGFLREVDAVNQRCRARTVDLARELAGGSLHGAAVCVLGAAFKPGSDDIRDSPALEVAAAVRGLGARVTVYDPVALDRARQARPELEYAASMVGAAADAEVVLLLTDWREFAEADPVLLGKAVARRNIVDGRNALDPGAWRAAGWCYRALGRP